MKPHKICRTWAYLILEEFFLQGDEEKKAGIAVGPLNDRDKINIVSTQHGFINFLVAPLMIGAVKIFRTLHPLAYQMVSNLEMWHDIWIHEVSPSEQEVAKRRAEIVKIKTNFGKCMSSAKAP